MSAGELHVVAFRARTPVGLGAEPSAAAVRAAISRVAEHPILMDGAGQPLRCARDPLLAPSALGAVARLGEMAIAALGEVLAKVSAGRALPARPRLLLALPEARPGFG